MHYNDLKFVAAVKATHVLTLRNISKQVKKRSNFETKFDKTYNILVNKISKTVSSVKVQLY